MNAEEMDNVVDHLEGEVGNALVLLSEVGIYPDSWFVPGGLLSWTDDHWLRWKNYEFWKKQWKEAWDIRDRIRHHTAL